MRPIKPFIWFEGNAEEAMNFYVSTFSNSEITHIERYTGDQGIPGEKELVGKVLTGIFKINGQEFQCLDGGPQFKMPGAISFFVEFDTQQELDRVWERMLDGGKTQQCGWISDKFGVIWQIAPTALGKMMSDPATSAKQKKAVMKAMMPMVKLDIGKLEAAYEEAASD
jgi:predicted 3-demethylubiquinone-9 3-methyltransferase (glyoxalase superfamily)